MSRLFLRLLFIFFCFIFVLFLPIVIKTDAHYDMNRKKFGFSVFIFGAIKLFGGYIGTYKGGIALHLSRKKAVLIPYSKMNSQRKRFSFIKTFRPVVFRLTTETGAEYLFTTTLTHTFLRGYLQVNGVDARYIENNLWLTNGDVLRVSFRSVLFFNLYILLKNFFKFIKEKCAILWRKKMKKSTA